MVLCAPSPAESGDGHPLGLLVGEPPQWEERAFGLLELITGVIVVLEVWNRGGEGRGGEGRGRKEEGRGGEGRGGEGRGGEGRGGKEREGKGGGGEGKEMENKITQ